MKFEIRKFLPGVSFFRILGRVDELMGVLINSTLSFRARARNLVLMTLATGFCRIAAQGSVNHFARNNIVMGASLERHSIRKPYSVIHVLVRSLVRPFSLREKARMRERKCTFDRSPNPLPMGEEIMRTFLMTTSDFGGK